MRAKPLFMSCALALWSLGCGGSDDKTLAAVAEGSETSAAHATRGGESHDESHATGEPEASPVQTGGGVHHEDGAHADGSGAPPAEEPGVGVIPRDGVLEALPRKRLLFRLRPAARRRLAAMLRTQRDGKFPPAVREDSENARLFLVAARNEKASDTVRVAALDGMSRTWSSSMSSGSKMATDEDFIRVVRHHLRSENPSVLAAAIKAGRRALPLMPIDEGLVRDMLILGYRPDPATQFVVLDVLPGVNNFMSHLGVEPLVVGLIDSREPFVAAKAIMQLGSIATGVKDRSALREALKRAVRSEDSGVRGRAIRLLSGIVSDVRGRRFVHDLCLKALEDPNGYVRSSAAAGLGNLRALDAVLVLERHLFDESSTVYDLGGWTQIDGSPGLLHHDGSMLSRVDDAVLDALAQASLPLEELAFKRRSWARLTGVELLERQREEAKHWIKLNRSAINEWTERMVAAEEAAAGKQAMDEARAGERAKAEVTAAVSGASTGGQ